MRFPVKSVKSAIYHYFRLTLGGMASIDLPSKVDMPADSSTGGVEEMLTDLATLSRCIQVSDKERLLLFVECFLGIKPKEFRSLSLPEEFLDWNKDQVHSVISMSPRTAAKELRRVKIRLGRVMRAKGVVA